MTPDRADGRAGESVAMAERVDEQSAAPRRTALVTGAARRLGRAIALRLARAGWRIAAHHNASGADAARLRAEIAAFGGAARGFQADLAASGGPRRLAEAVAAELGPIDALVNSAALFAFDAAGALDAAAFDQMMAMNVRQALALTDAALAVTAADAALDVVHILDQKALNRSPGHVSYTLSKIALAAGADIQAFSLGDRVRVNAVAPGVILRSGRQTDAEFEAMAVDTPLRRRATADEVAAAVHFLLDVKSLHGQTLYVDGGLHLRAEQGARPSARI